MEYSSDYVYSSVLPSTRYCQQQMLTEELGLLTEAIDVTGGLFKKNMNGQILSNYV